MKTQPITDGAGGAWGFCPVCGDTVGLSGGYGECVHGCGIVTAEGPLLDMVAHDWNTVTGETRTTVLARA